MTPAAPRDVLTPEHRRHLEVDSGLPPDILAEEGLYSLHPGDLRPIPDREFIHPNSHKAQSFPYWPSEISSGIVFPNRDHAGRLNPKIRPDTPRTVVDADGSTSRPKYESCGGARLSLYVPKRSQPLLANVTIPLLIPEGDKKTLAAAAVSGGMYAAVGLSGVWGALYKPNTANKTQLGEKGKIRSEPLPDWEAMRLKDRVVMIAFDSDRTTNEGVQLAERHLAVFLRSRGAIVLILEIPPAEDGSKQGVDDYIVNGGDFPQMVRTKLYELMTEPKRTPRDIGTDGEQTCARCPKLLDQVAEYRAKETLRRSGPFSPAETEVIAYLVEQADVARSNGTTKVALLRSEDAAKSNTNEKAVSRAWKRWEEYQADPKIVEALPFRLERRVSKEDGKEHVDLYPLRTVEPMSKAQQFMTVARLPRDIEARPRPGGNQRRPGTCTRCDSPMVRTTQDRCTNDQCNHVYVHPSRIVGGNPFESGDAGRNVPPPVMIQGAPFEVATLPVDQDTGQNVPYRDDTYPGQNVPRPSGGLISFVTQADTEAFAGPRYQGEAPSDSPPERPSAPPRPAEYAPLHHRAWRPGRPRPEQVQRVAGSDE